jgi:outer membrane protein TolC
MRSRLLLIALSVCGTSAFAGGPKYAKPDAPVPEKWQSPVPWQPANPLDSLPKNAWWKLFGDSELDQY